MKISPAYLAGMADSDGSFSIAIRHRNRPNPTYQATFQLTWTKTKLTEKFMKDLKKQFGGSYYEAKNRNDRFANGSPTIRYFLTNKGLKLFLKEVLPFIILKKKQVLNCLELLNTTEFGKYGFGRPKPKKLKKKHYNLYIQNKNINTKNSGDRRIYESI